MLLLLKTYLGQIVIVQYPDAQQVRYSFFMYNYSWRTKFKPPLPTLPTRIPRSKLLSDSWTI